MYLQDPNINKIICLLVHRNTLWNLESISQSSIYFLVITILGSYLWYWDAGFSEIISSHYSDITYVFTSERPNINILEQNFVSFSTPNPT